MPNAIAPDGRGGDALIVETKAAVVGAKSAHVPMQRRRRLERSGPAGRLGTLDRP